ncbi:MAG TPA: nodulation protein NfeD [Vicinamibacterales bacterium]|nr:nodulation protein NfeD [Vicinamibacterales bacterium]
MGTSTSAAPLLVVATLLWLEPLSAGTAAGEPPRAVVAEYDGIIHPIAAEFVGDAITRADAGAATVMVLVLRTPGGLLESTRTIVSRMIAARTPVVVFVGPSGARAASAGFIIALAADVAVMAPGTHIGAAHPVSAGTESPVTETMSKKLASDVAAYARTLAEARGRNAALAAEAVTESRAFTDREAINASPPLVDFAAADLDEVLRRLDGRTIKRFDGGSVTLETSGIVAERLEMTRRQRFLSAIAHPQIAFLLLTLGMLGLTVEMWHPGAIVPGVAGGLCLLLAFFAFQVLPVNTIGLLLIVFGLALLILELKVPSFGALGIGGTVSLLVGSVMLTTGIPGVRVGYGVIVPVVLSLAAIVLFLGRLALASQRIKPVTGAEGLVGTRGSTLTALEPGHVGQVRVHGEIWRATSVLPLTEGRGVRVTAVEGLTLIVEPSDPPTSTGGTP